MITEGSYKISVIVPIYNVEQYLPRCIDSILAQTYANFELLLINDGSIDNSGKICDEYAVKDSRVKVFHKENGGVSSARNLGLDNATGYWVSFIDADDYISNDFFKIPSEFNGADVIQKSHSIVNEDGSEVLNNEVKRERILNKFDTIARYYVNHRRNELWNKIISRRIIDNRRFDVEVAIGEDLLFFF